jgi:hypothetical protein
MMGSVLMVREVLRLIGCFILFSSTLFEQARLGGDFGEIFQVETAGALVLSNVLSLP